jgi:hypothetical protein
MKVKVEVGKFVVRDVRRTSMRGRRSLMPKRSHRRRNDDRRHRHQAIAFAWGVEKLSMSRELSGDCHQL